MKRESTDLFGEPLLKRSAHFPAPGVRRRLPRDWGQGRRAFILGCNPSDVGAVAHGRFRSVIVAPVN